MDSMVASRTETRRPALYELAEKMHTTPDGFARYDYSKCVWMERSRNNHPLPMRYINGELYVYDGATFAGVSAEIEQLLYVGTQTGRDLRDPHAWLVAERDIFGEERDRTILAVETVNHRLWMQLMPRERDAYRHDYLTGILDDDQRLHHAELWRGRTREAMFEDYEALESMIRIVGAVRSAQAEEERVFREREAVRFALGHLGTVHGAVTADS